MNSFQTYRIKGLHCASCASIIERTISKLDGVESISVNNGTEKAKIAFASEKISPEIFNQKLEPLGYSLIIENNYAEDTTALTTGEDEHAQHLGLTTGKKEKIAEISEMRIKVFSAIPLAILASLVMVWDILAEYDVVTEMSYVIKEFFHHLMPIFATYILFVVGKPYLLGFYRFLRYGKANMDTLIGIGTVTAFLYSFVITAFAETLRPFVNVDYQYYDVSIVVITLITLGKYLETKAKLKTGDAIEKLLNLQAKTALIVRDGKEIEISVNDVKHGDLVIVKPGAKIPVDGVIMDGKLLLMNLWLLENRCRHRKKLGIVLFLEQSMGVAQSSLRPQKLVKKHC